MIVMSRDGKSENAFVVEDTDACCKVLLSFSSHGIRDEFLGVIIPNKHHDFVVRHRLFVLLL